MESLTYGKLFNLYCADYSNGKRCWEDLVDAIKTLNVRYQQEGL